MVMVIEFSPSSHLLAQLHHPAAALPVKTANCAAKARGFCFWP
jgi:hypothetical protein